jgi:hypothetical protein
MTHDLKQRLVGVHTLHTPREVRTDKLINPDGPAALARIEELEGALREAHIALSDVLRRIETSPDWWIDEPDRGGFDKPLIENACNTASAALKGGERNG